MGPVRILADSSEDLGELCDDDDLHNELASCPPITPIGFGFILLVLSGKPWAGSGGKNAPFCLGLTGFV